MDLKKGEIMRLKFLYHSGIAIENSDLVILIDPIKHFKHYKNKNIYCLITHSHSDHYNKDISHLENDNNVVYILSEDIKRMHNSIVVKKGDVKFFDDFSIEVFGTTDLGVSYLIKVDEKVIFHSGDLNWWHWPSNSLKVQLDEKNQYMEEIEALKNKSIDYAFVPVDPRLKEGACYAMDYFISSVHPRFLIPIHFSDAFDFVKSINTDANTKLLIPEKENSYLL